MFESFTGVQPPDELANSIELSPISVCQDTPCDERLLGVMERRYTARGEGRGGWWNGPVFEWKGFDVDNAHREE